MLLFFLKFSSGRGGGTGTGGGLCPGCRTGGAIIPHVPNKEPATRLRQW
ncbi:MAG: hypothetical protein M3299_04920 [Thermoproteota archaeon]|nr:hypothetical protein [Thermoproteota archaeon]